MWRDGSVAADEDGAERSDARGVRENVGTLLRADTGGNAERLPGDQLPEPLGPAGREGQLCDERIRELQMMPVRPGLGHWARVGLGENGEACLCTRGGTPVGGEMLG